VHPRLAVHARIAEAVNEALVARGLVDWPALAADQPMPSGAVRELELAVAYNDQAGYCARMGENELAVQHFREAERLAEAAGDEGAGTLLDTRLGLAVVLRRMGDVEGSRDVLAAARPLDPGLVDAVSAEIAAGGFGTTEAP
jgi:hypothetical protein